VVTIITVIKSTAAGIFTMLITIVERCINNDAMGTAVVKKNDDEARRGV